MHDLIVVSDLHLGRGKNRESGRYFVLEAFFYDDDFDRFCRWLCDEAERRKRGLKLVLNGDTFDLLRIEHDQAPGATIGERLYGPLMTPSKAAETVADILRGHRGFVDGIARVLCAGHQVVMLPGNHDWEVQWPSVQSVVRNALLLRVAELRDGDEHAVQTARDNLLFEPWFHHEPGRIWIEHGCQYDAENAFRYPLRGRLAEQEDPVGHAEHDLPVGTFFQRYLYNGFGAITFIVPNSKANVRYVRWLAFNKPRLLARTLTRHLPFFFQVLRRIAKSGGNGSMLARCHQAELDQLAERTGLGHRLLEIDGLKNTSASAAAVAKGVTGQIIKAVVFVVLLALLALGLWFAGFSAINEMRLGFGFKAGLFLVLNFIFLITATVVAGWLLLRSATGPPVRPARRAATRIAELVDVPMVTFGHTHDEAIWRLRRNTGQSGWYYNTGTWIAVFTSDELLPRERVQYTFLRIRDHEGELLHWSPGRGEAIPVVLLEDEDRAGEQARPHPVKPA